MSAGAVFNLLSQNTTVDKILTARDDLLNRLKTIKEPSVCDVEDTHIVFIHSSFRQFISLATEYQKTHAQAANMNWDDEIIFSIPQFGTFLADMVINVEIDEVGDPTLPAVGSPQYEYCDYPGARIFSSVKFEVNNNPIDEYDPDDIMFYRKFTITEDAKRAWDTSMGQQVSNVGQVYHPDEQVYEQRVIYDGLQTKKTYHGKTDLWCPLNFWFNKSIDNALPDRAIPYGQRFIKLRMAKASDIVHRIEPDGTITNIKPNINKCVLYTNNIFINNDISDIYMKTAGFNLIRLHLSNTREINKPDDELLLNNFKYAVEYIMFGFRPLSNKTSYRHWHKFTSITEKTVSAVVSKLNTDPLRPPLLLREPIEYQNEVSPVSTVEFSANGNRIFPALSPTFYNAYLQTKDTMFVSSTDPGAMIITFAIHPNTHQPSGHLSMSAVREFYIRWTSDIITISNSVELIAKATAINFLIIKDGSASLNFAT